MDLGLADRVIVVTGASSGLGLATARALAGDGARLVLAARDPERLETARGELAGLAPGGADALDAVALDVTGPDAADRLHARALERFGRVDGVLVNAAGPPPTSVRDSTDEQWAHAVETLFLGSVRLLRTFATRLPAGGAIAVVLSVSVRQPIPALGISNGLRPGLAGVIKSLAEEVGPDGVRVNGLLPGWTRTPRAESVDAADPDGAAARRGAIPLGRYGEPEEFGRAAAFLLSPAASYVTGAFLPVDGGVIRGL